MIYELIYNIVGGITHLQIVDIANERRWSIMYNGQLFRQGIRYRYDKYNRLVEIL